MPNRKPIPPFPRLSGRLYFFPAFLPLAELAPWLLGVLAAVTGMAGFTNMLQRHRKKISAAALVIMLGACGWWYALQPDKIVKEEGTQLVAGEKLPVAKIIAAVPAGALPAADKFSELWNITVPKQILSTPILTADKLIYGSFSGSVEAVARRNGAALWSLPQSAYVFALAGSSNGLIYAGTGLHQTESATMTAIDPATGEAQWQREFLGHIENAPLIDPKGKRMWLGSGPGGLWAVSARNGHLQWHKSIGHIDSTPLLVGDVVYAPAQADDGQSALYALDADTGKELWKAPLPGQPWGTPALNKKGDAILITSGLGQIGVEKKTDHGWTQAIGLNGKILWQKELPNMAIQPDVYVPEDDIIIYAIKDGSLLALKADTGQEVWRAAVGKEFESGAVRLEGDGEVLIAATAYDGTFTIRRASTGAEVARRTVGGYASSSPVSDGDTVYVTTAWTVTAFGGVHSLRSAH